ncbi:hypothetical protein [Ottowia caeni]|uniref:hypothetical protein n=1 Tax=Ottowia caeni TaxID=2870339 RepID=UPI003D712ED9
MPSPLLSHLRGALLLTGCLGLASCATLNSADSACPAVPPNIASSLPAIDGFMIDKDDNTQYSSWLGRKLADGRLMREPINMIVIDPAANSDEEAAQRLVDTFSRAGFGPRPGHSSGYFGKMNGKLYTQQPATKDHAFSDYMWAFSNNHARFFGPYQSALGRVWIGASSREKGVAHDYVSFSQSRQHMQAALVRHARASHLGCLNLNNQLDLASEQTGDHDGYATVLSLDKVTRLSIK